MSSLDSNRRDTSGSRRMLDDDDDDNVVTVSLSFGMVVDVTRSGDDTPCRLAVRLVVVVVVQACPSSNRRLVKNSSIVRIQQLYVLPLCLSNRGNAMVLCCAVLCCVGCYFSQIGLDDRMNRMGSIK